MTTTDVDRIGLRRRRALIAFRELLDSARPKLRSFRTIRHYFMSTDRTTPGPTPAGIQFAIAIVNAQTEEILLHTLIEPEQRACPHRRNPAALNFAGSPIENAP